MFAEPRHQGHAGRAWALGVAAAVVLLGVGIWILTGGGPETAPTPSTAPEVAELGASEEENAEAAPAERSAAPRSSTSGSPKTARSRETSPSPATPPVPATSAPSLRVESDVPGAMVFLNRKYLGTTPLVSRDVSPGSHQLNVQVEGREPVVQTVEIGDEGETRVAVEIEAVRLDARVAVVHKHGIGSCEGTLIATPAGLRYQTSHDKDGFTLTFAQLETFTVDYLEKSLRVKQHGGRTWNFTTREENADPLYVFHREVEAAR